MIYGRYNGQTVHIFIMGRHRIYVVRSKSLLAGKCGESLFVTTTPGVSYRQAAAEAESAWKQKKFKRF